MPTSTPDVSQAGDYLAEALAVQAETASQNRATVIAEALPVLDALTNPHDMRLDHIDQAALRALAEALRAEQ